MENDADEGTDFYAAWRADQEFDAVVRIGSDVRPHAADLRLELPRERSFVLR